MLKKIIIAGSGGQGIMLLGKVLAEAAMREDKFVTWLPAYGAEVRGGTANCAVVISDEEISSPYIEKADSIIIMNGPSLLKFKDRIKDGGLLFLNSSLIRAETKNEPSVFRYPFTEIAVKLGNIKVANMVALGLFIARTKVISPSTVFEVITSFAPKGKKDLIEINKKALEEGARFLGDR